MKKVIVASPASALRAQTTEALERLEGVEVVTTASRWSTCLKKVVGYEPDACLVDLEVFEGSEIPRDLPSGPQWIALSGSSSQTRSARAFESFVDLIDGAPAERFAQDCGRALGTTLRHAGAVPSNRSDETTARARPSCGPKQVDAIGIGVSTGGPQALRELLARLPASFPVPVLIVQHIPTDFSASLAESLDAACPVEVKQAEHGELVYAGRVYIAPGGRHMRVAGKPWAPMIRISDEEPEAGCRPSVNVMFRSMLKVFGVNMCNVIMTGMGDDGLAACAEIHKAGGHIIAQEASTCTVYGMPRAIIEHGVAHEIVELTRLAQALQARLG